MLFLAIVAGMASVVACGSPDATGVGGIDLQESDSAGVAIVQITGRASDLPLWTLADEPAFEVRGDAPPFVGRVGQAALLADGRLLLEDDQAKTLYAIEADGSSFSQLGVEGDGPGEFRDISALSVLPGDTIHAFDRRHLRFTTLDPEGGLVTTVGLEAHEDGTTIRRGWAFESGRLVTQATTPLAVEDSPGAVQKDQRDVVLNALNAAGEAQKSEGPFEGGYTIRGVINSRGIIIVAPFANVPIVASGQDFIVHGSGLDYELVVSSSSLEPSRIVRWEGWREAVSDSLLDATRAQAEEQFADLRSSNPEMGAQVVDAMFMESFVPERLPALGAAMVDELGQIWVSAFRASTDRWNQSNAWHVLDPMGRPLARVQLPAQSRLVAVRSDRVALVTLDDLDVEHVGVFEIESTPVR